MRLLVVTAVQAELEAVLHPLAPPTACEVGPHQAAAVTSGAGDLVVVAAGVGSAASASVAAAALALDAYDVVLSLGVAGGFRGRAAVGDVVVADRVVVADLGVESPGGFLSTADVFGVDAEWALRTPYPPGVARRLTDAGLAVRTGAVLTVSTVTGTDERAQRLAAAHPTAVAEAMEGYGVLTACRAHGTPFGEVRSVSNVVERRDRAAWDVAGALRTLSAVAAALFAAPLPMAAEEGS